MMHKRSRRHTNDDFSQSASLMLADVFMAGLMGILFLAVGSHNESGLMTYLSPYYYETEDTLKVSSADVLHLNIDASSHLFINDAPASFSNVEKKIYDFVLGKSLHHRTSYLWLRVSRGARYDYYIELRDAIKRAKRSIANEWCIRKYEVVYSYDLPLSWRKQVDAAISLRIIAEEEAGKPYFEETFY